MRYRIERHGRKAFVVIPYEEFLQIEEELHAYEDLKTLAAAKTKEAHAPTVSLNEARRRLKL